MDGQYFWDTKPPWIVTDPASVTLSTTNKALLSISNVPAMGRDYWYPGKKVGFRLFGRITTAATPGNLTVSLLYGTGADNNGVSIVASAAQTLIANQTSISWELALVVHCRSIGSAGTLFGTGKMIVGTAVIAAGTFLLPASAPAVSGACDLTVAGNVLSVQALRSGSTVETMQVHDFEPIAMN